MPVILSLYFVQFISNMVIVVFQTGSMKALSREWMVWDIGGNITECKTYKKCKKLLCILFFCLGLFLFQVCFKKLLRKPLNVVIPPVHNRHEKIPPSLRGGGQNPQPWFLSKLKVFRGKKTGVECEEHPLVSVSFHFCNYSFSWLSQDSCQSKVQLRATALMVRLNI